MFRRFVACGVLVMLAVNTPAKRTFTQGNDPSYDLWFIRSQGITQDLIKDAADFQTSKRAILFAELAKRWWPYDSKKAKTWILLSIESVEDIPNKETADERRRRLKTTRELLKIVAPLDKELGARLIELLSDDSKQRSDVERLSNADGLFETAVALVDVDPQRAYQLGVSALRLGGSGEVSNLVFAFRRIKSTLADELLKEALLVAKQNLEPNFLLSLARGIFPAQLLGFNGYNAPDHLGTQLLRVDLSYIQANPITAERRDSVCAAIIGFIVPVMTEFELRLPQQAPVVRQAINRCQSVSPLSQQLMDDGLKTRPLNTVDELLKAADDAEDLQVKTVYQYRAASLAKEQKKYERALSILDGISKEGREFMGTWQWYRWDWSALAALDYFARGDFNEMRQVIAKVPQDLQAYTKLTFVYQLPATRNTDADPTLEFLSDARKTLPASYGSDSFKYPWYFALLRLTVKYQPADVPSVLKEAITVLNRSEQTGDTSSRADDSGADPGIWTNVTDLADTLIEIDEFAVKEAVASIGSIATRNQVRLALLQACLSRMRGSLEKTKRGTSTSNQSTP